MACHVYRETHRDLKKSQPQLTASFFTVANKKWPSIEFSQISAHFSVRQSEIWVRDELHIPPLIYLVESSVAFGQTTAFGSY